MKSQNVLFEFILKEWLLVASASGFVVTSVYLNRLPAFSITEFQILFILAVLFVAVKGIEQSGLLLRLSQSLEKGKLIPLKLVIVTFFLSMLVTNDVALIVVVPLTLALNTDRKDILVILEALSANAGSALTPIGNPQNLFIYWFYDIRAETFLTSIAPFSFVFLVLLVIAALLIKVSVHPPPPQSSPEGGGSKPPLPLGEGWGEGRGSDQLLIKTSNNQVFETESTKVKNSVFIYVPLLLTVIFAVLHIFPIQAGFIVIIYAVVFDRNSLRIDYPLLLTFFSFFGLAANIQNMFAANIENSGHIFIFSSLSSQIISNVPSALLFAKFTTQWKALLWGTNVGGFGSLVGSLANLIAYKFYIINEDTNDTLSFTIKFLVLGYIAFVIGILLYWSIERIL